MKIKVKFTQGLLFEGQNRRSTEHSVKCSNTEKFANGVPKPVNKKWDGILSTIHLPVEDHEPKYEIVE